MQDEKRRHPRFAAIGRVEAEDLCVFPGTLMNISSAGCRIRFPIHVTIDMDREYELRITFSQNSATKEMLLIGQPVYAKSGISSEIGFKLLRSPGSRLLDSYIEACMAESSTDADEAFLPGTDCAEPDILCRCR